MDDNTKKEQFSYAYIKLLASISGLVVIEAARPLDNAGIDITIRAPGMIRGILSPSIDAQVKCTATRYAQIQNSKFKIRTPR